MDNNENFINWVKLVDCPVYNASMMKPCPEYENSIVGICNSLSFTPSSAYEDTVSSEEDLGISLFIPRYAKNAMFSTRINKDHFTKIMYECVKSRPKKYVWEHPDFDAIFNSCISGLCNNMNNHDLKDLFLCTNKPYVLSTGTGFIYNNGILSGTFSGLVLTAGYTSSEGVSLSVCIPKLIYNTKAGALTDANLTYEDKVSNMKITINGSVLSPSKSAGYETKRLKHDGLLISISKIDLQSSIFNISNDAYSELISKKLWIPMTKLDLRLSGILGSITEKKTIVSQISKRDVLQRLTMIER